MSQPLPEPRAAHRQRIFATLRAQFVLNTFHLPSHLGTADGGDSAGSEEGVCAGGGWGVTPSQGLVGGHSTADLPAFLGSRASAVGQEGSLSLTERSIQVLLPRVAGHSPIPEPPSPTEVGRGGEQRTVLLDGVFFHQKELGPSPAPAPGCIWSVWPGAAENRPLRAGHGAGRPEGPGRRPQRWALPVPRPRTTSWRQPSLFQ